MAKQLKNKEKNATPTPVRAVPLRSLFDVRRYLAKLINQMRRNEIKREDATSQTYVLNTLIRVMELQDIQQQITEIEQRLENRNGLQKKNTAVE